MLNSCFLGKTCATTFHKELRDASGEMGFTEVIIKQI